MRIRIPRPVNTALDWVAANPDSLIPPVVLPAAGLVAFVNVPAALVIGSFGLVAFVVVGRRVGLVARLRSENRDLRYDLAALDAEVRRLRQGDPTAPTVGLLPIRNGHLSDERWPS